MAVFVPIASASVSPNLLPLLGVQPLRGRNFSSEEAEQQKRLVLISHRFWRARFGGANGAIGATIALNGLPSEIIGILPPDFRMPVSMQTCGCRTRPSAACADHRRGS
jgi:hypothetical protein